MKCRALALVALLVQVSCSNSATAGPGGAGGSGGRISDAAASGGAGGDSGSATDATNPTCLARDGKLQNALDQAVAQSGSPDGVLAIDTPDCGQKVYVSGKDGLSPDALFRIGSVTKTYVASVIMRLAGEGKLSLGDTLDQYLPNVPKAASITLKMLLQQTSGLYDYTDAPVFRAEMKKTWTPEELVQIAIDHGPDFSPGTRWEYSNTNYIVLGMIAEKVTDHTIAALIHQDLLAPNSLSHTFFDGDEPLEGTLAPAYGQSGQDVTHAEDPSAMWAAGAIAATPGDVASWIDLLGSGKIDDPATLAEMEQSVPTGQPGLGYGLGLFVLDGSITGAGTAVGHLGDTWGYHTQAFYFLDSKTTIVAIVNKDGADPNVLSVAVLQVLFP